MRISYADINYVPGSDEKEKYQRLYRLSNRDNVNVYIFPKGKAGKKAGSFLYKNKSAKAQSIEARMYEIKGRIRKIENSTDLTPKEKIGSIERLRCLLKYSACKLSAEMASLPYSGFIVTEKNDEEK